MVVAPLAAVAAAVAEVGYAVCWAVVLAEIGRAPALSLTLAPLHLPLASLGFVVPAAGLRHRQVGGPKVMQGAQETAATHPSELDCRPSLLLLRSIIQLMRGQAPNTVPGRPGAIT